MCFYWFWPSFAYFAWFKYPFENPSGQLNKSAQSVKHGVFLLVKDDFFMSKTELKVLLNVEKTEVFGLMYISQH